MESLQESWLSSIKPTMGFTYLAVVIDDTSDSLDPTLLFSISFYYNLAIYYF